MGIKNTIWTIAFCWSLVGTAEMVAAQNPLRSRDHLQRADVRLVQHETPTQRPAYKRETNPHPYSAAQILSETRSGRIDVQAPERQSGVAQAGFQQIPKPHDDESGSHGANVLGSAVDKSWQDPKKLVDLIMKLSLNLVFVLSFAFGVILIAKRLMKPKSTFENGGRVKSDSLNILQTLRLDAKTSIRLVQWRSNRFLVACDQNGIQSVNPLNASFEQTLQELDEDESDEKLIRKLLANLDSNRG